MMQAPVFVPDYQEVPMRKKVLLHTLFFAGLLTLTACTGQTPEETTPETPTAISSSAQTEESSAEAASETTSETISETASETTSEEPSEAALETASQTTSETVSQADSVLLEVPEMNFSVELPPLLKYHYTTELSSREAYGETIQTLRVFYRSDTDSSLTSIVSFEEMSSSVWEQVQAEGGPLGSVLGESEDGRVVILNSLQSNPFSEGSPEFELFQDYPSQASVIQDSFQFLE